MQEPPNEDFFENSLTLNYNNNWRAWVKLKFTVAAGIPADSVNQTYLTQVILLASIF